MSRPLVLYSTAACHLCEQAEALLVAQLDPAQWHCDWVDIAASDELVEAYGSRIPVLASESTGAELGWPFDAHQLAQFLADLGAK